MPARAKNIKGSSRRAVLKQTSDRVGSQSPSKKVKLCLSGLLVFLIIFAFWPLRSAEFVNYDDPDYVTGNPVVQQGLTKQGIIWAFTTSHSFNWHPVTWISHMVDCQFFGVDSGKHHVVNIVFHAMNTLLLLLVFSRATRQFWPSLFCAALFALHPLHVESVAWVCERKDVLSTFFWLLTMVFYLEYTRRSGRSAILSYGVALVAFALGLMSKPMLVTLPFVLLLMDYWPLNRCGDLKSLRKLFWEKVPFFGLTIASSIVTFLVQRHEGAVASTETFSIGLRIANAFVSYVKYLGKTFWPTDLVVFYVYPLTWPAWIVTSSTILLLMISVLILKFSKGRRYLMTGWFWFLGTLVPVIGLVQVGLQSLADRYMYVPMIGLTIAIAWLLVEVASKRAARIFIVCSSVAALLACTVLTRNQVAHWRNSETLFEHALAVSPDNVMAHVMLANASQEKGNSQKAITHFEEALKRSPRFAQVHYNLGNVYVQANKVPEAIRSYEKALENQPDYFEAHANLAIAFEMSRQVDRAIEQYRLALKLRPMEMDLWRYMATDLYALGQTAEASETLQHALQVKPDDALLHVAMGDILVKEHKLIDAAASYATALRLQPGLAEVRQKLAAISRQ